MSKQFKDTVTTASVEIVICAPDQYLESQGIHLNSPDEWYLNDAIETAAKDNFARIFMHYGSKSSQYSIPCDVLRCLFDYAQDFESFTVRVIDPRGGLNPTKANGGIDGLGGSNE